MAPTLYGGNKHAASAPHFRKTTILTVPMHQLTHLPTDWMCLTFCNASAPEKKWLKNPEESFNGNGTVCEKTFSRLVLFHRSIRSMHKTFAELFYFIIFDGNNARIMGLWESARNAVHSSKGRRLERRMLSTMSRKKNKFQAASHSARFGSE